MQRNYYFVICTRIKGLQSLPQPFPKLPVDQSHSAVEAAELIARNISNSKPRTSANPLLSAVGNLPIFLPAATENRPGSRFAKGSRNHSSQRARERERARQGEQLMSLRRGHGTL